MDKKIPTKKIKDLIIISSFILLLLIILLFSQPLNKYDHCILCSLLINASIFIIALFKNEDKIIDIIHIGLMIYIFLALFSNNIFIILIFILILTIIFFYWIRDNTCPMGQYETLEYFHCLLVNHPFESTVIPIVAYLILFYKLHNLILYAEAR